MVVLFKPCVTPRICMKHLHDDDFNSTEAEKTPALHPATSTPLPGCFHSLYAVFLVVNITGPQEIASLLSGPNSQPYRGNSDKHIHVRQATGRGL